MIKDYISNIRIDYKMQSDELKMLSEACYTHYTYNDESLYDLCDCDEQMISMIKYVTQLIIDIHDNDFGALDRGIACELDTSVEYASSLTSRVMCIIAEQIKINSVTN